MFSFINRFSRKKLIATVSLFLLFAVATPFALQTFWYVDADAQNGVTFVPDKQERAPEIPALEPGAIAQTIREIKELEKQEIKTEESETIEEALASGMTQFVVKTTAAALNEDGSISPTFNNYDEIFKYNNQALDTLKSLKEADDGYGKQEIEFIDTEIQKLNELNETIKSQTTQSSTSAQWFENPDLKNQMEQISKTADEAIKSSKNPILDNILSRFSNYSKSIDEGSQNNLKIIEGNTKAFAEGLNFIQSAEYLKQLVLEKVTLEDYSNGEYLKNSKQTGFTKDEFNEFYDKLKPEFDKLPHDASNEAIDAFLQKVKDEARVFLDEGDIVKNEDYVKNVERASLIGESLAGLMMFPKAEAYDIAAYNSEFWYAKSDAYLLHKGFQRTIINAFQFSDKSDAEILEELKTMFPNGLRLKDGTVKNIDDLFAVAKKFKEAFPNYKKIQDNFKKELGNAEIILTKDNGSEANTAIVSGIYDAINSLQHGLNSAESRKQYEMAVLAKSIQSALTNNLNNNFFGQEYLAYLRADSARNVIKPYYDLKQSCKNYPEQYQANEQLKALCTGIDAKIAQLELVTNILPKNSDGTPNVNFDASVAYGTVGMNPRTQHLEYTTSAIYFDKETGAPKIGGKLTFDPSDGTVKGDLTARFGDNARVTLYSDTFTGDLYLEYSKITGSLAKIGGNGSIFQLNTLTVAKDGAVGGSFNLFHKLMNYNPTTKAFELALVKNPSGTLWVSSDGMIRGSYNFKVGGNISTGLIVDSKGNFTIPINFTKSGTTLGSVYIGQDGQIGGQIDLGKTITGSNGTSLFVGFDKNGISSVGAPIGGIAGSPFSFSVAKDGSLSFGGFVPVAGLPVPVSLGQDQHGNAVISWPGGHWTLGHEDRPINAPVPAMSEDGSGYKGDTIWYRHSFKKGMKTVRVYNKLKITPEEQQKRGDTIFKVYNENLKRNPSISEFLNWYFYQQHEIWQPSEMENRKGEDVSVSIERRITYLTKMMTILMKRPYTKVVPAEFKFPNSQEYKWIQDGKDPKDFKDRPTDLLTVNPFSSGIATEAQTAANDSQKVDDLQKKIDEENKVTFEKLTNKIVDDLFADSNSKSYIDQAKEKLKLQNKELSADEKKQVAAKVFEIIFADSSSKKSS